MNGFLERAEMTGYSGAQCSRGAVWAPWRASLQEDDSRHGSRLVGVGVLVAFALFSGVSVVVARGHAFIAERYGISPEAQLVTAWLIQGVIALIGFALAVRWLRSESH